MKTPTAYDKEMDYSIELIKAINSSNPAELLADGLYRAQFLESSEAEELTEQLQPFALQIKEDTDALREFKLAFFRKQQSQDRKEAVTPVDSLCKAFPFIREYLVWHIKELVALASGEMGAIWNYSGGK
jgi:hypothetical protein